MGATKRAPSSCCRRSTRSRLRRASPWSASAMCWEPAARSCRLFRQQIRAGGPVTLTDWRVTRYFMTVPEAAQLVLQASAMAEGGELFVLDMGEPVRIGELAQQHDRTVGPDGTNEGRPAGEWRYRRNRPAPGREAARGTADRRQPGPQQGIRASSRRMRASFHSRSYRRSSIFGRRTVSQQRRGANRKASRTRAGFYRA